MRNAVCARVCVCLNACIVDVSWINSCVFLQIIAYLLPIILLTIIYSIEYWYVMHMKLWNSAKFLSVFYRSNYRRVQYACMHRDENVCVWKINTKLIIANTRQTFVQCTNFLSSLMSTLMCFSLLLYEICKFRYLWYNFQLNLIVTFLEA